MKRWSVLVTAVLSFSILAGCAGGGEGTYLFDRLAPASGGMPGEPEPRSLILTHSSPAGSLTDQAAQLLKEKVEEASEGLRRVSLVAAQNPRVRFDIDADGDLVTMSAMDSDVGDASEQVEVPVEGSSVAIGLNHRYVSDCLSAVSDREKVLLELQGEMQPAVFKSFGTPNYLQLIMPTRL